MVDRGRPSGTQDPGDLREVARLVHRGHVDEDVERPHHVDGGVGHAGQVRPAGQDEGDVVGAGEARPAQLERLRRHVDEDRVGGARHEDVAPAAAARADLEHGPPGRDAGQEDLVDERRLPVGRLGPLLSRAGSSSSPATARGCPTASCRASAGGPVPGRRAPAPVRAGGPRPVRAAAGRSSAPWVAGPRSAPGPRAGALARSPRSVPPAWRRTVVADRARRCAEADRRPPEPACRLSRPRLAAGT